MTDEAADILPDIERAEYYRRRYLSTVTFSIITGILAFVLGILVGRLL